MLSRLNSTSSGAALRSLREVNSTTSGALFVKQIGVLRNVKEVNSSMYGALFVNHRVFWNLPKSYRSKPLLNLGHFSLSSKLGCLVLTAECF